MRSGKVVRPDGATVAFDVAGDVRAVADELGVEGPAVIGSSFGGGAAAVYAALSPARAIVCVDNTLRFGDFAPLVQNRAQDLRGENAMEAVWETSKSPASNLRGHRGIRAAGPGLPARGRSRGPRFAERLRTLLG